MFRQLQTEMRIVSKRTTESKAPAVAAATGDDIKADVLHSGAGDATSVIPPQKLSGRIL